MDKYELVLTSTKIIDNQYNDMLGKTKVKVYQIKALKDFGNIKKGDLGGFVESYKNLSQEGNCWISNGTVVYGNAEVLENANISGYCQICDNAKVLGNTKIETKYWYDESFVIADNNIINENFDANSPLYA